MNLNYHYWYFDGVLSKTFCENLIKYGNKKRSRLGTVGDMKPATTLSPQNKKHLKKIRQSDIAWLDDIFIYKAIQPYVNVANKNAGWNFHWDWSETAQFTKYKKNQFYHWHCDDNSNPYKSKDPHFNNKIRKLSVTVSLNEGYEGGELEFDLNNSNDRSKPNIIKCNEIKPQGSIVVFPSFLWHRVAPVTKGTRYSLVVWNIGDPWR
jgi:PKHD-type hydroxylase